MNIIPSVNLNDFISNNPERKQNFVNAKDFDKYYFQ